MGVRAGWMLSGARVFARARDECGRVCECVCMCIRRGESRSRLDKRQGLARPSNPLVRVPSA